MARFTPLARRLSRGSMMRIFILIKVSYLAIFLAILTSLNPIRWNCKWFGRMANWFLCHCTAVEIVGEPYASTIAELAVKLYKTAHTYALTRGVIIADTKFEFGVDEETNEVVLADEVLTPDSSRFWPKDSYEVGRGQQSFDKQFLRDWLVKEGLKGKPGVRMSDEIAQKTSEKYREAWERITGGN